MINMAKTEATAADVMTFPKERIMMAAKYQDRKDIVGVLLVDGKEYSFEQVDAMIEKFMKGKVN